MDFEKVVDDIKTYIETQFPIALAAIEVAKPDIVLGKPDLYLLDYPDTGRQQAVVFFIYPDEWEFSQVSNVSREMANSIHLFTTFKGTSPALVKKILRYMEALYSTLTTDDTLGNAVEQSEISSASWYKAIEASADTKAIEVVLRVSTLVH
ncbi:MAG: hypothetical protein CVV47_07035 [Spirochaetae bacterium HGW-Spirochaetae-3]|jgi:hypothetical protein|nr:MAG: hypothetical protein CVV47_07035 [Spirochaetae bacterium HGW-Spirochaetae-3]